MPSQIRLALRQYQSSFLSHQYRWANEKYSHFDTHQICREIILDNIVTQQNACLHLRVYTYKRRDTMKGEMITPISFLCMALWYYWMTISLNSDNIIRIFTGCFILEMSILALEYYFRRFVWVWLHAFISLIILRRQSMSWNFTIRRKQILVKTLIWPEEAEIGTCCFLYHGMPFTGTTSSARAFFSHGLFISHHLLLREQLAWPNADFDAWRAACLRRRPAAFAVSESSPSKVIISCGTDKACSFDRNFDEILR